MNPIYKIHNSDFLLIKKTPKISQGSPAWPQSSGHSGGMKGKWRGGKMVNVNGKHGAATPTGGGFLGKGHTPPRPTGG